MAQNKYEAKLAAEQDRYAILSDLEQTVFFAGLILSISDPSAESRELRLRKPLTKAIFAVGMLMQQRVVRDSPSFALCASELCEDIETSLCEDEDLKTSPSEAKWVRAWLHARLYHLGMSVLKTVHDRIPARARPRWATEVQAEIAPPAESRGLTLDAALDRAQSLALSLATRRTRRQQDFENKLSEALSRSVLHHSDLWASTGEGAATQADTNMTSAAASTHSATSQVGPGLHHAD